jgi:hypothetical protein
MYISLTRCFLDGQNRVLGKGTSRRLDARQLRYLTRYYEEAFPEASKGIAIRTQECAAYSEQRPLDAYATYHAYIILGGRRIVPSTSEDRAPDSIVQIVFNNRLYVGQATAILSHTLAVVNSGRPQVLLEIRWFREDSEFDSRAWDA